MTLSKRVAAARVQHNHARPHCVSAADASRPTDTWQQAWVDSGLVNATTASQQILPARGAQAPAAVSRTRPKAASPPAPLPANALVVYTDGAGPESWWGRQTAGWGFTVVTGGNGNDDAAADETHSRCGHVVTDAQQPGYIGAERPTNNTGELTAIAQALEYILADRSGRPVLVRYDSLYAGNMAAGKWRPRKNKVLVSHVRRLWTRAHTHLHGRLWTSHVYGHSNHQWNDRADALASQGRGGAPT